VIRMLEPLGCVGSTNDEMRARALTGAAHGAAVWADEQTAGRGRNGRTWFSPAGASLYFSVLLRFPHTAPHTMLPLAAGVGAACAIEQFTGQPVGLKWPNDLVFNAKKLGGILCEAVTQGDRIGAAVVGIGVNLTLQRADLPDELDAIATSLAIEGLPTPDPAVLAAAMREHVLRWSEAVLEGQVSTMIAAWRQRDATLGRRVRVLATSQTGDACGIDDAGRLLVSTGAETLALAWGEIEVLK
jgi:BirA family biotin operon repressor/biotin-[acetyl-CoA-carboxylase] ligase